MAEQQAAEAPPQRGRLGWLLWGAVALVAVAGGAAVPFLLPAHEADAHAHKKKAAGASPKREVLPFGDVVVNLGEDRLTRYLRVKILLVVDEPEAKEVGEVLTKQKAFLKSWLIGYLADQSLKEVGRAAGVNRIRREVRDQFNAMLFPDGEERILEVLFDEFVVQ